MIQEDRIQPLTRTHVGRGQYVLLWVQATVRTTDNHALEYAIQQANQLQVPLVAVFGLTPNYPEANARHYQFLLEGLADLRHNLQARGVPLAIEQGHPPEVVLEKAKKAALVVTDVGYTRHQREWRTWLAARLTIPLIQVESEAVIPVKTVSAKQEYAARTIRPKIHKLWDEYLVPLETQELDITTDDWPRGLEVDHPADLVQTLPIDQSVSAGEETGGEEAALKMLEDFVAHKLEHYDQQRNDPTIEGSSRLSAYLHYGHLSPLTAALIARKVGGPSADVFLEELIVRRELSFNFCTYNPHYDEYQGLPDWAKRTLEEHAGDSREFVYTYQQFEEAVTHDPYWNAAQNEMVRTGRMHNYMRMYWGKKILEWTSSPQQAFEIMLQLNNKYQQDGRDPNSFVGVGWVLGLHDRPWTRRPVFGTVRYMNAAGLKRKFKIEVYARRWE